MLTSPSAMTPSTLRATRPTDADRDASSIHLVTHARPAVPGRRLVCFPFAGGGAGVYKRWAEHLAGDVELLAVQLPGRENRVLVPPLRRLTQAADLLVSQLQRLPWRPTVFFGHSMGALLAYETALRLPPACRLQQLVVSGRSGPHMPPVTPPVATLDDSAFMALLGGMGGTSAAVLNQPELMRLLLPMLRADFGMVDNYRPEPAAPTLSCPVLAVHGRDDPSTSVARMQAWATTTHAQFGLQEFPGGHFFLHDERARLVRAMGL
jgi:medium-chain acyl-[acyl-carrier-protein] hydrolase